ncbi:methionine--tRNA ligase [Candidatus Woesearchaeota archaeon]|nr:methionine--tRNA ligase [Candidatus Woesearchaeota archaeon]
MAKKTLVTSALLYANGPMHIGHLVEYIQTDIYVRFLKLIGEDVIYCCADDTHGAPVSINAEKQGITPEELISGFYREHVDDFKRYLVEFDSYHTTNSKENKYYSDLLFNKCKKNGFIYKKKVMQLFCSRCKRFLPDRYVKGSCPKCGAEDQYGDVCEKCGASYKATELSMPYCSICRQKPVEKESEHYFFKLSVFSAKLEKWLTENKHLQKEIVNSVRHWIKEGLNDWDITRDGPYFGFKIPEEENLYYYVWFDAPIGYIASTENYCRNISKSGSADDYWLAPGSRIIHFIGKDIIYFHFLFWPAVLMASGFNLPESIIVHGFLTVNGEKMSKSRGTLYTARELAEGYEPEYLRYYYANMLSRKIADLDLNFSDFTDRVNNELVANLGNFCFRTLTFLEKNLDSEFVGIDMDNELIKEINNRVKTVHDAYKECNLKDAIREIMAISALGNRYFQDNEPWKLIKEDRERAREVLGLCVNIAKNLAVLIRPIMPAFSDSLQKQLGLFGLTWESIGFKLEKHRIKGAEILIKKIEKEDKEKKDSEEKEKKDSEDQKKGKAGTGKEKLMPFNLKVGKITEIDDHPDAEKLFVMQVDLGDEKRQLVAGLKPFLPKHELLEKKIIVVTNLEHAKLRGVVSQGMLLAADKDNVVKVIEPKSSRPGDRVYIKGYDDMQGMINIKQFMEHKRLVKDKHAEIDLKPLVTDSETIEIDMPDKSEIR